MGRAGVQAYFGTEARGLFFFLFLRGCVKKGRADGFCFLQALEKWGWQMWPGRTGAAGSAKRGIKS